MTSTLPAQDQDDPPVFLDAVLHPHRSLPLAAFRRLMLGLGLLSLAVGAACVMTGAWPVFGFFGLDVLLIYLAFRVSYRAARQRESVRLTASGLTVEQVSIHGARRLWRFEPAWLAVRFRDGDDGERSTLAIGSHGRMVVLGSFLAPEAKKYFAAQLSDALGRWRAFIARGGAQ